MTTSYRVYVNDLPTGNDGRRFRDDLYHRISVLTISTPSLHQRPSIPILAEHFLAGA